MKRKTLIVALLGILSYAGVAWGDWVQTYHGYEAFNEARGIAVDPVGNVYVTGYSAFRRSSSYLTIKYDANGKQKWVKQDSDGRAHALALEVTAPALAQGVYVTGQVADRNQDAHYRTVKYAADGTKIWTRNVPVSTYRGHEAVIAADILGNVFVAGGNYWYTELGGGIYLKYLIACYAANGAEKWVKTYIQGETGYITAVGVPPEGGGVYVTGSMTGTGGSRYVTIKYDADGNEQWMRSWGVEGGGGHACALAVDRSGNVYVAGYSYDPTTKYDFATVKYDSQGNEQWVRRFNGPKSGDDQACALAVDSTGNVFVTGSCEGPDTTAYATVKYDADGNQLWVQRYGPPYRKSFPKAMAVDLAGNLYVTGTSEGEGTGIDVATVKYDPDGNLVWVKRYEGPGNDAPFAMAVKANNVYVTGFTATTAGKDFLTLKYEQFFKNSTNGHLYKVLGPGSWQDCENAAKIFHRAHLVTINDQQEQDWLVKKFGGQKLYWIGLTDKEQEGTWKWISKAPVGFTNWAPGQPDNAGSNQNYGVMNYAAPGQWGDDSLSQKYLAIIEKVP
jgi:hypothetical protein